MTRLIEKSASDTVIGMVGFVGCSAIVLFVAWMLWTLPTHEEEAPIDYEHEYLMERALRVGWEKEAKLLADSVVKLHVKHNAQGLAPACRWPPYSGWDSAR